MTPYKHNVLGLYKLMPAVLGCMAKTLNRSLFYVRNMLSLGMTQVLLIGVPRKLFTAEGGGVR
jgi:hypothetical protein